MTVRGTTIAGSLVTFDDGELLKSTSTSYEVTLLGQTFALNFYWLSRHNRYAVLVSTAGRNLGYAPLGPEEYRLFPAAFDDGFDLVVGFASDEPSVEAGPRAVTNGFGAILLAGVFD